MGEHNPQAPCEHSIFQNLETVPCSMFLSPLLMSDSINKEDTLSCMNTIFLYKA